MAYAAASTNAAGIREFEARVLAHTVSCRFCGHDVVEIACNDGYLLQHFVAKGVPVLGLEPAANVAEVAVKKGIPLVVKFFGRQTAPELAAEFGKPGLLIGNNVLAHVPDLNDFVAGMKLLLD